MKYFLAALILALSQVTWAQTFSQDQVENKVHTDLENMLSKILEPSQFSVQVSAAMDKVSQRQLVEGEQITQKADGQSVQVPPLPGFDPQPFHQADQGGQTRQVFRSVDKFVLRGLTVNLMLNQGLDENLTKTISDSAKSYLDNAYPSLASLSIHKAPLRSPVAASWWSAFGLSGQALLLFAAVAGLLGWMLLRIYRKLEALTPDNPMLPLRSVHSIEPHDDVPMLKAGPANGTDPAAATRYSSQPAVLGPGERTREKSAFAGVPTNPQYADHRRQLLDAFLQHASVFRQYFGKLDQIARAELCSALSGPAFETLLESLKLEKEDTSGVNPPNEEHLQFYVKNFSEFHEALRWQDQQFFGFLPHLTEEQLAALVQSQNPVVGALILKFSRPEISAAVLEKLGDKERAQIIDQFERTREMSPTELKEIEHTVRDSVRTLPNFILGNISQELEYWSGLLAATTDPQKLLGSLQTVRPDLYERLAKFRFQIQDIPSLPAALVRKVMDDFENDDLARALSHQPGPLVQYALEELPEARRRLVQSQILSYQNIENSDVQKSVEKLTRRFREVLA